jgi:hypothetical protein
MHCWLALILMSCAAAARAEPASEAEFRAWYRQPANRVQAAEFERYLARFGVQGVLPTGQILRTASDWRSCGSPFEVPPASYWTRIVPVLRFIRDEVRPRIGPVEAVSGYRNPRLNRCAAGAPRSAHVGFWGLDLVPRSAITQRELFRRLCALHRQKGRTARFGLGFYGGLRFHVDTKGYRLWGSNHRAGTSPCL